MGTSEHQTQPRSHDNSIADRQIPLSTATQRRMQHTSKTPFAHIFLAQQPSRDYIDKRSRASFWDPSKPVHLFPVRTGTHNKRNRDPTHLVSAKGVAHALHRPLREDYTDDVPRPVRRFQLDLPKRFVGREGAVLGPWQVDCTVLCRCGLRRCLPSPSLLLLLSKS